MKLPSTIVIFSLFSAAAFAQQAPESSSMSSNSAAQPPATQRVAHSVDVGAIFDQMNPSHSGRLTREEAQAYPTLAANFDRVDTNKDGVVTRDEFIAAFKPR
jgi:EF hand